MEPPQSRSSCWRMRLASRRAPSLTLLWPMVGCAPGEAPPQGGASRTTRLITSTVGRGRHLHHPSWLLLPLPGSPHQPSEDQSNPTETFWRRKSHKYSRHDVNKPASGSKGLLTEGHGSAVWPTSWVSRSPETPLSDNNTDKTAQLP